jgi:hypothetical protein
MGRDPLALSVQAAFARPMHGFRAWPAGVQRHIELVVDQDCHGLP